MTRISLARNGLPLFCAPIGPTGSLSRDKRNALAWGLEHGLDLRGADLSGADLREFDFRAGRGMSRTLDLSGCDFSGADLSEARMCHANLSGSRLAGATIAGADLDGVYASAANFSGADLSASNLQRANLSRANFSGCDLRWALMVGADLVGATFFGADLRWAAIDAADMPVIRGAVYALFDQADPSIFQEILTGPLANPGFGAREGLMNRAMGGGAHHGIAKSFFSALCESDVDAWSIETNAFLALAHEWVADWQDLNKKNISSPMDIEARYEYAA